MANFHYKPAGYATSTADTEGTCDVNYVYTIDWGADDPVTMHGTFVNIGEDAELTEEAKPMSKENEILLDLLVEGAVRKETLKNVRRIIATPEWDARFLLYLLLREVEHSDLDAEDLGIHQEADE